MEMVPEEINRQCLLFMPYQDFPAVGAVCKSWRAQIEEPEFMRDRKVTGNSQTVVVMAQVRVDQEVGFPVTGKSHQLTVFEPGSGDWRELPPVPRFSGWLPMFCGLAAVGSDLVVIGGWHGDTWEALSSVFVFSFLSGTWRRGADMPGGPRSFFGVSSDSGRMVYVAGGHDGEKNALRSALAYDVAEDAWITLPDMARERDECKGVFHRGRFHVIGGYDGQMQGKFGRSTEEFDVATWRWGPVQEDYLAADKCPRNCINSADGALYTCHKTDVVALRDDTWEVVARLPADVDDRAFVMTWDGSLFVMGSTGPGDAQVAYTLDMKKLTWTKLETPEQYTGHVLSGCCLEI